MGRNYHSSSLSCYGLYNSLIFLKIVRPKFQEIFTAKGGPSRSPRSLRGRVIDGRGKIAMLPSGSKLMRWPFTTGLTAFPGGAPTRR